MKHNNPIKINIQLSQGAIINKLVKFTIVMYKSVKQKPINIPKTTLSPTNITLSWISFLVNLLSSL